MRDALGLKNNDALWLVLMALEHYKTSYKAIPRRISDSVEDALRSATATADATFRAAAQATKADIRAGSYQKPSVHWTDGQALDYAPRSSTSRNARWSVPPGAPASPNIIC